MKKPLIVLLVSGLFLTQLGFAQESDIIEAAKSGNAEKVKNLLKANPELIQTNRSCISPSSWLSYLSSISDSITVHKWGLV